MVDAMMVAERLALADAVVVLINMVPAFMPPTWAVLAFLGVRYPLLLLPLTVGGAFAAGLGRTVLALALLVAFTRIDWPRLLHLPAAHSMPPPRS